MVLPNASMANLYTQVEYTFNVPRLGVDMLLPTMQFEMFFF
jgi:hypothetical protein